MEQPQGLGRAVRAAMPTAFLRAALLGCAVPGTL